MMFRQAGQPTYQGLKGMNHPAAEKASKTLSAKPPIKGSEQEPHVLQSTEVYGTGRGQCLRCVMHVAGEELHLQHSEALCVRGRRAWGDQYSMRKEHLLEILCRIETEEMICIMDA